MRGNGEDAIIRIKQRVTLLHRSSSRKSCSLSSSRRSRRYVLLDDGRLLPSLTGMRVGLGLRPARISLRLRRTRFFRFRWLLRRRRRLLGTTRRLKMEKKKKKRVPADRRQRSVHRPPKRRIMETLSENGAGNSQPDWMWPAESTALANGDSCRSERDRKRMGARVAEKGERAGAGAAVRSRRSDATKCRVAPVPRSRFVIPGDNRLRHERIDATAADAVAFGHFLVPPATSQPHSLAERKGEPPSAELQRQILHRGSQLLRRSCPAAFNRPHLSARTSG